MASILYSSNLLEIRGKVNGTVFQRSPTLPICRTKVKPRNPATGIQQRNRWSTQYAARTWRLLTETERLTWFGCLTVSLDGYVLYLSVNIPRLQSGLSLQRSFDCPLPTGLFERPYFASQFQ